MNLNKKLKKYVDEMPAKKAEDILPEEAFVKNEKKKNYRWAYPVAGLAAAGVVAAFGISVYNNTNKNIITSSTAGEAEIVCEKTTEKTETKAATSSTAAEETKISGYKDGVIEGETVDGGYDGIYTDDLLEYDSGAVMDKAEGLAAEGIAGEIAVKEPEYEVEVSDDIDYEYANSENITAGTLTGGELRDLLNWDNYTRNIDTEILTKWGILSINKIEMYLKNDEGAAENVKVALLDASENVIYSAISDVNGKAYLFYNLDGQSSEPVYAAVYADDGSMEKYDLQGNLDSKNYMEIKVDNQKKVINLDLMFMIDTTGSMGDELEYLKVEIQDVIERASEETGMNIRTSVNFYRDDTDEYIVKYYDFRDDAQEVAKLVGEQSADGGGDFPEAVHKALDNALNSHNWNKDSYKLMFIVLDAPPHEENADEVLKYVEQASAMGVRIIPIISSGADEETENIFRSYAVMTGGTYLFLDDNSGIGYDHTVPVDSSEYDSEYLNEMIIRVIGEYCGKSIEASTVEQETETTQGN